MDLHAGGNDLVFPHHENEIAQSEAATGQPFVRHWFHTAFVNMGDAKMSKRLGNVRTLEAIAALGLAPADFRAWGLSTHYRQPTVFLPETLEAAASVRRDFAALRRRLRDATGAGTGPLASAARDSITAMDTALDEDLNVSAALAALHGLKTAANRGLDQGMCAKRDAEAVEAALNEADSVFGWLAAEGETPLTGRQQQLLDERRAARACKDWKRSDALRAELAATGLAVDDTPAGQRWRRG